MTNAVHKTNSTGKIRSNCENKGKWINLLPRELESSNHSQKLYEQMTDQNHQHQILIQHLMYHLTCPATERAKYSSSFRTRIQKSNQLPAILLMKAVILESYFHLFQPKGRLSFVPLRNRFDFPHASSFQIVDQLQIMSNSI